MSNPLWVTRPPHSRPAPGSLEGERLERVDSLICITIAALVHEGDHNREASDALMLAHEHLRALLEEGAS